MQRGSHAQRCYALVDESVRIGDAFNEAERPQTNTVVTEPRSVDIYQHGVRTNVTRVEDLIIGKSPMALAVLTPNGEVVVDDRLHKARCQAGWTVNAFEHNTRALGPNGHLLVQRAGTAVHDFLDDPDHARIAAYRAHLDKQLARAVESALSAARAALHFHNMGGALWTAIAVREFGPPMVALAARDLIGTGNWTQEYYDVLTAAWRVAYAAPIHPDDIAPADLVQPLPPDLCEELALFASHVQRLSSLPPGEQAQEAARLRDSFSRRVFSAVQAVAADRLVDDNTSASLPARAVVAHILGVTPAAVGKMLRKTAHDH